MLPIARHVRRLLGIDRLQAGLGSVSFQQGLMVHQSLMAQPRYQDSMRLLKFGYSSFSQSDEDGIIEEIFKRIAPRTRKFLEIGAGNGWENCTCNLLLQGWSGIWFDAGPLNVQQIKRDFSEQLKSGQLQIRDDYIDLESARAIIRQWPKLEEFDLFCIDIDGNDYHVIEAMGEMKPRLIVLEYNAKFRPPIEWVMPYKANHWWDGTHRYGASLASYCRLMDQRGYNLVGCNISGNNAFFVRKDLVGSRFCEPFTAENHFEPARYGSGGHPTEVPRV